MRDSSASARRKVSVSFRVRSAMRSSKTEISKVVASNMKENPPIVLASQPLLMNCGSTVQRLLGAKIAAAIPV